VDGKVKAGVSTITLGGVSLVAYVLAVIAFLDGQRNEATISAVTVGTLALLAMAAGRFWQAVEQIRARRSSWGMAAAMDADSGTANEHPEYNLADDPESDLEDDPDGDVAPPDASIYSAALDDPGHPPAREHHSRLKG
jgi:hypothetical protein